MGNVVSRGGSVLLAALLLAACGAGPAPSVPVDTSASPTSVAPSVSGPAPSPSSSPAPSPRVGLPAEPRVAAIPRTALNATLDRMREALKVPGVSVAIRWDDGRVWLGSSGLADVAARTPMTPDIALAWASVSKTVTGAVALQLVEEGVLGLEDSVARWIPDRRVDPRITVHMLLDHTSGLTDFFLNPRIDGQLRADPEATWTASRVLKLLPPGSAEPGTSYHYSNTNYLLLGLVIEAATRMPLAESVRERLLDPLGLTATWTQAVEEPRRPLARAYRLVVSETTTAAVAVAPASDVSPFRSVVTAAGGAGGIAGTADDAARWIAALAAGDVLEPATRTAALADAEATRALGFPYGLGIQVVTIGGQTAIGHSGRYTGVRSSVRYFPGEHLSIAVLTNQSVADPARIAAALLAVVAVPRPQCAGCPEDR